MSDFTLITCQIKLLYVLFFSPTDTDQAYHELIVKKASALLSSVQLNMLKFALSLRAYSATVHSFQQVTGGAAVVLTYLPIREVSICHCFFFLLDCVH